MTVDSPAAAIATPEAAPAAAPRVPVTRTAAWIGDASRPCLAWFHAAPPVAALDAVAVICPPIGHEYTITHRTVRHLADRFARAGIAAVRFDYDGTGDSAGDDRDPDRLGAWERSAVAAIAAARAWRPGADVVLVGIRVGALIAARIASRAPVHSLILWNPPVTGRHYLRELQALAMANELACEPANAEGDLECAGYLYTAETRRTLSALDLRALRPLAARVLLAGRDDAPASTQLAAAFAAQGHEVDAVALPGWSALMTEHQFSQVPAVALDHLVAWSARNRGPGAHGAPAPAAIDRRDEVLCRFGPGERLFGILSRPAQDTGKPAVVLFNAGSVHRVGPNRVTVEIARALVARGHRVFRFDLESLGDSVLEGEGRENHPYPPTSLRDAREAFQYLRRAHGIERLVAMGLCSGAHTIFHSALEYRDPALASLVLINPLTWRFHEGMSLATAGRFLDQQAYRKSMRDASRWMKLLKGQVNVRRLAEVACAWPADIARARWASACERWWPAKAPPLARDLAGVLAQPRSVALFIAENDPGLELLLAGAPRTARRALDSGRIYLERIPAADHTFTRQAPRQDLLRRLTAYLEARPA